MPAPLAAVDRALAFLTLTVSRSTSAQFPFAPHGSLVVSLFDPLLVHNAVRFRQRVTDAIAAGDVNVVLDLEQCGYVDARGMGAIVSASRALRQAGGCFIVTGVNEDLAFLFHATKLDEVLTIVPVGTESM